MYKEENKKLPSTGGIIVIRSLIWPGAYVLYQNERWFTFYAGYGHKADQKDYYPVCPPLPQFEPIDPPEQAEPNPKEAPKAAAGLGSVANPAEILQALNAVANDQTKFTELLDKTFEIIDKDKSGEIDRKELDHFLKEFIKEIGIAVEPDTETIDHFFKEFDKDASGTISKEELAKALELLLKAWATLVQMGLVPSPANASPAPESPPPA